MKETRATVRCKIKSTSSRVTLCAEIREKLEELYMKADERDKLMLDCLLAIFLLVIIIFFFPFTSKIHIHNNFTTYTHLRVHLTSHATPFCATTQLNLSFVFKRPRNKTSNLKVQREGAANPTFLRYIIPLLCFSTRVIQARCSCARLGFSLVFLCLYVYANVVVVAVVVLTEGKFNY